MVYGAALEMRFGGNPIEGSNPSLSASSPRTKRHLPQVWLGLLIHPLELMGGDPGGVAVRGARGT